ncbi:MAG: hydrogenase small subunit [Coriobacteriales bacterium]|jgi:hydrogenase small subunit|nr:hydrogenase small subunit [Coriobacteriales bacterium]
MVRKRSGLAPGSATPNTAIESEVALQIQSGNIGKLEGLLAERGISRRRFLEFSGAIAIALGLSEVFAPLVQEALADGIIGKTEGKLAPVIWLELASCTGCTESFAQGSSPDVATVVLELISLNYSETLSAGAGHSLEQAKDETIEAGGYIVVIEGALMEGWDGNALRIANEKGTDIVKHAVSNAMAIVCAGSCSVDGGWQAAKPNPGGAIGIQNYLNKALAAGEIDHIPPLINVPTCPSNPEHLVAVLVDVLLLEALPELDRFNKPTAMFGQYVHDNCPRRGHFENGEFVYQFGSEEEKKGYCLYPMGCKGPQTKNNCPIVRWNRRVSWCVESGAPCIGCSVSDPTTTKNNWVDSNSPFLKRFRSINIAGFVLQPVTVAAAAGGLVLGALAIHGIGMKLTGRLAGGADFEKERTWDLKHPENAVSTTFKDVAYGGIAKTESEAEADATEIDAAGIDSDANAIDASIDSTEGGE